MKDISLLKEKLAAYSALASVMLAANPDKADAQIIYHDIIPDAQIDSINNNYLLDLDNDGVFDFKFTYLWTYLGLGASSSARIQPYNNNELMAYYDYVAVLIPNQTISANAPGSYYWSDHQKIMLTYDIANYGEAGWVFVLDGFAGIIFKEPDGDHYGWIRMTHGGPGNPIIIKDYAYQSLPDSSILAGEIYPTHINNAAAPDLFNVFIDDHQLILHFNQSSLPSQVTLWNDVGEKLIGQTITQSGLVMDVSRLAAGIYFVVVDDGEKRHVKKVVIGK